MKKLFQHLEYVILFILCLTPILWFWGKGDAILNGVDTNFPLDPYTWFQRRFFVWNGIVNGGIDFSSSVAGLFFHLLQVIPYKLGLGLQRSELLTLIFWFSAIVISAYILARAIFPKNKLICILFVVLYAFNPYLFNTWENAKVANLSLVAAIPASLALLISLLDKKVTKEEGFVYSLLTGVVLSGGGINPAYFIMLFLVLVIFLITRNIVELNLEFFKRSLNAFLTIFVVIFLVNLFWILPTTNFIFKNISLTGSIETLGFTNWVDSLSQNTSLLNVMRIQGAWDWYAFDDITKSPIYIPYAVNYFYKFPFIFFSFLLPALAMISFIAHKGEDKVLYGAFGLMLIVGVFLGAGAHVPTGSIFLFLADHIPFFSLFRSPWYVFTPLVTLGIAGLIGLLFINLDEKVKYLKNPAVKSLVPISIAILIIGSLLYNYPLVTGKIFRPGRSDSFYVQFPSYVFETKNFLSNWQGGRIIGYPDDELEKFNWGYIGIESILSLFSDKEILFSSLNNPNSPSSVLIREFYQNLKKNQIEAVVNLASKLNIGGIFYKKDQSSLATGIPVYLNKLSSETIGQWQFFMLPKEKISPKIYTSQSFVYGYPYNNGKILTLTPNGRVLVNPFDQVVGKIPNINNLAGTIISSENSQEKAFNDFRLDKSKLANRLLIRDLSFVEFNIEILKDSTYTPVLERYRLEDFGLDLKKEIEVEIDGQKNLWEIIRTDDSFVYFAPIAISQGKHVVTLGLQNKSLTFGGDFNQGYVFNKGGQGKGEGKYLIEGVGEEKYLSIINIGKPDISADFSITSFDPLTAYYFEFKYKQIYGNNGSVFAAQNNDKGFLKVQLERLPNYPEWQNFSFFYEPVASDSNLRIELAAPFTTDPLGTKIFYDDVRAQKVFLNDLFFIAEVKENSVVASDVIFNKKSPVLYEGLVKNSARAHVLVFAENYSPEWELTIYGEDNKRINNKPLHFSANSYANGWYLDNLPQNYKFRIYYKAQDLLKIGLLVSLVTIITIVVLFLKAKLRKRKG